MTNEAFYDKIGKKNDAREGYVEKLAELSLRNNRIEPEMYTVHDVKRGLRDINGNGVVTGLTEVSVINWKKKDERGVEHLSPGELFYRGINIKDIVEGFVSDGRHGFEETVYLLLFSELPNREELLRFSSLLSEYRKIPHYFVRDMIFKAPGHDIMNMLSRCVLALYSYDGRADDIAIPNVLRQCLQLIAQFPLLAVYAYQSHRHYHNYNSLFIHYPKAEYNTAQNILYLLREDGRFTPLEAKVLDLALVLHAEHGGGNNSTFTTHVLTSTGTDTYSAVSAALGSLKGPRHGGANIKVVKMFEDMKACIDTTSEREICGYLEKLLDKQAFDRSGLIYGIGHAVYSLSDPRAEILHKYAKSLSEESGMYADFQLYERVARIAPEIINARRSVHKAVSPNVDFYSGLVYKMLGIPEELYTPIFAMARIAGWSAHRLEEIQNAGKIIRPAYIGVKEDGHYVKLNERK